MKRDLSQDAAVQYPEQSVSILTNQPQTGSWPAARKIVWMLLFLCAVFLFGRGYVAAMRPPENAVFDFFKEWAAVRNWSVGMPVYSNQHLALEKHLGMHLVDPEKFFDRYNTHPPTANFIALPFKSFSYRNAHLAWNLVSLGLFGISLFWIVRGLEIDLSIWKIVAVATLLLACDPLKQSLIQGQPNLLLTFLIIGAWRADQTGRPAVAGMCVALATAVKIYPAYLFLYFLVRLDWRALVSGLLSLVVITSVTAALFGATAYRDYLTVALPSLADSTNNWGNASLLALWERLFEPSSTSVRPLTDSPIILRICVISSSVIVTGLAALAAWKTRVQSCRDSAFAITIVAMLLVSPTTWHHYFVMLALPVALLLVRTEPHTAKRLLVNLAIAALAVSPRIVWILLIPARQSANLASATPWEGGGMIAVPWQSLTALSYQCYSLLAIIAILWTDNEKVVPKRTIT